MFLSELFCGALWLVLTEVINLLGDCIDGEFFNRNLQKSNDKYFKTIVTSRPKRTLWRTWLKGREVPVANGVVRFRRWDEDAELYPLVRREFKAHSIKYRF